MRRSEDRILTTHTGSLPRPPELTRLYVRRARGESVDPAELDRLGQEALRSVLRKQAEAEVQAAQKTTQARTKDFDEILDAHYEPMPLRRLAEKRLREAARSSDFWTSPM